MGPNKSENYSESTKSFMTNKPTLLYEDKVRSQWRPYIGWTYIAIIIFDFIIAPSLLVWYSIITDTDLILWQSLTLSNGGIFHATVGVILGVSAWTRGQEKVKRIEHNIHDGFEEYVPELDNEISHRGRRFNH